MLWYKSIIITYHTDSPVTFPALRNLVKYSCIFLAWSISLFFWQSGASSAWGAFLSRAMEQLPNATPSTSSQERHDTVIPFKGLLDRRLHIQFLNIGNLLVRLMSVTACQLASYFRTFRWDFHCKIGVCQGSFADGATIQLAIKGAWWYTSVSWPLNHARAWFFFRDDYRTIQYNPTKSNDSWFLKFFLCQMASKCIKWLIWRWKL